MLTIINICMEILNVVGMSMAVYHGVVATLLYIGILGLSNILDRVNPP